MNVYMYVYVCIYMSKKGRLISSHPCSIVSRSHEPRLYPQPRGGPASRQPTYVPTV